MADLYEKTDQSDPDVVLRAIPVIHSNSHPNTSSFFWLKRVRFAPSTELIETLERLEQVINSLSQEKFTEAHIAISDLRIAVMTIDQIMQWYKAKILELINEKEIQ